MAEDPAALLQSKPELCVDMEDVVAGDIMLFMLIPTPGLDCCCERDELPIPGLFGAIAGNEEFKEFSVLSGVIVLLVPSGAERFAGGDTGGVDHENVAAGEALLDDRVRFTEDREGKIVDEEADVGALAHGSPPSMSPPLDVVWLQPLTSVSKSASPVPFVASRPLVPGRPPKLMSSFRDAATLVALFAPSSWSFLVCSFSTRADRDLMSSMYAWN